MVYNNIDCLQKETNLADDAEGAPAGDEELETLLFSSSDGGLVAFEVLFQMCLRFDHVVDRDVCLCVSFLRQPMQSVYLGL